MGLGAWRDRRRRDLEFRDEQRGYRIDKKRVIIAYLAETVIVAASLWGAWLFANTYGHNDTSQMQMMMLAPIGYAVIEYCRVPLAISARAHASRVVKFLAVLGVICASGVTIKSMSQLGEIMFRPRLFDVVHAAETVQHAKASQASMAEQIAAANALVNSRHAEFTEIEQRAKSDAIQLATLPKDQCNQTSGVTTDGRPWKGQACKTDTRIVPLRDNLKATITARDEARQRLDLAVATRSKLDQTATDRDLSAAEVAYREAILHSQLHSFTGMFFGVAPTEVSDQQIHRFLRIFVFFPAIFVAFASTFVACTAVHRLPPKLIPFDPEGTDFLLNPIYQHALAEAVQQVHDEHRSRAEKLGVAA